MFIIYLGKTTFTDCIDWDISTTGLKHKLEELSNIDSVRVDQFGNGVISTDNVALESLEGISFVSNGSTNITTASKNEKNFLEILSAGDRIIVDTQAKKEDICIIILVSATVVVLDRPVVEVKGIFTVAKIFGYRYIIINVKLSRHITIIY